MKAKPNVVKTAKTSSEHLFIKKHLFNMQILVYLHDKEIFNRFHKKIHEAPFKNRYYSGFLRIIRSLYGL